MSTLRQDIKLLAREHAGAAVAALVAALKDKGERVSAASMLLAYGFGKPQATTNIRVIHSIQDLSEEELRTIAGDGVEEAPLLPDESDASE